MTDIVAASDTNSAQTIEIIRFVGKSMSTLQLYYKALRVLTICHFRAQSIFQFSCHLALFFNFALFKNYAKKIEEK